MNLAKKILCRSFQIVLRLALPILPYRDPLALEQVKDMTVSFILQPPTWDSMAWKKAAWVHIIEKSALIPSLTTRAL